MEWPVNGNILLDYNMDQTVYFPTLDQYKLSPAIAVQAAEGLRCWLLCPEQYIRSKKMHRQEQQ